MNLAHSGTVLGVLFDDDCGLVQEAERDAATKLLRPEDHLKHASDWRWRDYFIRYRPYRGCVVSTITVIGVGPGDPDLLTLKAREAL